LHTFRALPLLYVVCPTCASKYYIIRTLEKLVLIHQHLIAPHIQVLIVCSRTTRNVNL
jgi:hypothetical protein